MSMEFQQSRYRRLQPQLWGGLECTINRVGEAFKDQLELTRHYYRPDDINRFAELGLQAIRYPLLWEKHQPAQNGRIDWSWADRQMALIKSQSLTPIIGLVHHGSGPVFTDLLKPSFATGLQDYGSAVAARFPWVDHYTPVNEPLTTARFSGLYGLWYPHKKDSRHMALMLLNQLKATVLTMRSIRAVNPEAKLVQTEDLARTHSTKLLAYQADFENERRWLTFDLLCGRVHQYHPMYTYFLSLGIPDSELQFFLDNPCPPDIVGLNYYITSERFLDDNLAHYPVSMHGGNGRHCYADTEAVRTGHSVGLKALLQEAWDRFHLPIAVTEVHLACNWQHQIRWFKQAWDSCCSAIQDGIDLRAVTAWSLLGSYNWNKLLTTDDGYYEPGVYDCSSDEVMPTPLSELIIALSTNSTCFPEILNGKGWWELEVELFPQFRNNIREEVYA